MLLKLITDVTCSSCAPAARTVPPCWSRATPEGTSGAPFPASLQPHGALRLLAGGFKTPSGRSMGLRGTVAQLKGHRSVHLGGHARIPSLGGKGSIAFPCLWPTTRSKKRGERDFQKEAGRDGGNISVKLLRVLNKLHLSNIMIIFFLSHFWQKFLARSAEL